MRLSERISDELVIELVKVKVVDIGLFQSVDLLLNARQSLAHHVLWPEHLLVQGPAQPVKILEDEYLLIISFVFQI